MDFKEIEDLTKEDITGMYEDIMKFADDTRIAGCCCHNGAFTFPDSYLYACRSWCRSVGSFCTGWFHGYVSGHMCFHRDC